ncbi:hypothetical protein QQZ08_009731 [Neonectria magnoliae]|uniref:Rhodopsin domain-containing protein n=1 Tax=Neonectria magnoliae TaxID=2732573 RepID=A0ABR1HL54_9HYPO
MRPPGGTEVQLAGWVLIALSAAVIAARIYLRLKIQRRRILMSDLLMCAALASGIVTTSFNVPLKRLGALEPNVKTTMQGFDGNPEDIPTIFKLFWLGNIPFWSTFYFSKATLLSMYLQIFPDFMRKRRIFLWATIIYVACAYVASIVLLFFICFPISTVWDLDPNRTCPSSVTNTLDRVTWALHFFGDLLVFALPWFIVPALNMRRSLKFGMYCTFLLGIINIGIDLNRFIIIQTSRTHGQYSISLVLLWCIINCNLGIFVACLPALRPYFSASRKSSGESNSGSHKSSASGQVDVHRTIGSISSRNLHLVSQLDVDVDDEVWSDSRTSTWSSNVELIRGGRRVVEVP